MNDGASTEEFYDQEIAPALRQLAEKCAERGISLVAFVEYRTDGSASTVLLTKEATFASRLAALAARANGNFDLLCIQVARYAREHGHTSAVLKILETARN